MTFYETLEIVMKDKGIKATELCAKAGLHDSYLSKLKSGHIKDVTWEKGLTIIAALDMEPDEFLAIQMSDEEWQSAPEN